MAIGRDGEAAKAVEAAAEPQWNQQQVIAFECARDCIVDLMAICSSDMRRGKSTAEVLFALRSERSRLATELRDLHVDAHAEIDRVNRQYGQRIRQAREEGC